MSIKRVAVWGAKGTLAPTLVDHIVKAGFEVTVLSRSAGLPAGINQAAKAKQVADFEDKAAVTEALRGQDAVISTVGGPALRIQNTVIDAAIDAGVKLFLPSEYGCTPDNEKNEKLPVFAPKAAVKDYLAARAAEGKITYTLVASGPFLDFCLDYGIIVSVDGDKPTRIFDGGDVKFSTSNLDDVGKAVAGVLKDPAAFRNRTAHFNSVVTTQNEILAAAKKASVPGKPFPVEQGKIADVVEEGRRLAASQPQDMGKLMMTGVMTGVFDPSHGNVFPQEDTKKLGIKVLDQQGLEQVVAAIVHKKQKAQ